MNTTDAATHTDHAGRQHVAGTAAERCEACQKERAEFFGWNLQDPIAAANWQALLRRRIAAATPAHDLTVAHRTVARRGRPAADVYDLRCACGYHIDGIDWMLKTALVPQHTAR